jgi:hypothetical protein
MQRIIEIYETPVSIREINHFGRGFAGPTNNNK